MTKIEENLILKSEKVPIKLKDCTKCDKTWPLTEKYWYKARPRTGHNKESWQSYCRKCWIDVNRTNKEKRNNSRKAEV